MCVNVFANMKTKGKILVLVLFMALLLGTVGYTGYYFNNRSSESLTEVYEQNLLPITWLFDALVHGQAIQSDVAQILLAHEAKVREELDADIARRVAIVDERYAGYGKLPLDAFEKEHFELALKSLADYRVAWRKARDLAVADRGYEAYQTFSNEVTPLFTAYQAEIRLLAEYAQKGAGETNQRNAAEAITAFRIIAGISVGAVLLGALLGLFIASRISGALNRLRAGVEQFATGDLTVRFDAKGKDETAMMARALAEMAAKLRSAMRSIAGASEKLGSNAEEFSALAEESNAGVEESRAGVDDVSSQMESLAAASQEINASVEEVASGAQSSAQKGTEMAGEVERARLAGEEGTKAVEKVVRSVAKVAEDAKKSSREVKSLGDRAREIQNFVAQIGGIADQTNLLALNAAIEAARAGEAGRGFAVVAEEVRKLAEESNEAAKKIAELASGITKDLDSVVASSEGNAKDSVESSKLAEETRTTIERMMEGLSRISMATQDLAAVSEEQAASSEEIAGAVQNIASRVSAAAASSEMVRGQMAEVGTSAERVAQGSEELAGLADELRKLVGAFKFDEEGCGSKGLVPLRASARKT